jgi:uncharacterized protein YjbI with pentapeptide repeats
MTKTTLSALTLCGTILATSVVSQPSYGAAGFNGASLQGVNPNGSSLQGVNPNGSTLQGSGFQGTSYNGLNAGLDGRVVDIEFPAPAAPAR